MKLTCEHCGQRIKSEDINLDRMVAKCRGCDAVFDFSKQIEADRGRSGSDGVAPLAAPRLAEPVPLPDGITVEKGDDAPIGGAYRVAAERKVDLRITRKWFRPTDLFMLLFSLVWMGFLVFWYGAASASGAPWIFFVFPLIHVSVGVGLFYRSIAGLVNRTTITVNDDVLSIRHGPLPWPGNREVPVAELTQLYCDRQIRNNKNGQSESYTVNAVLRGDRAIKLLRGLPESAQALYIEKTIEAALGIEDRHVPGEL